MNPNGGGYAATVHIGPRRARLRGHPSGFKGRCAIADATGPRPALDPGASAAPPAQRHGQDQRPCPPNQRGARLERSKIPTNQVSTVRGDCQS
jgi:hypothetical protein